MTAVDNEKVQRFHWFLSENILRFEKKNVSAIVKIREKMFYTSINIARKILSYYKNYMIPFRLHTYFRNQAPFDKLTTVFV